MVSGIEGDDDPLKSGNVVCGNEHVHAELVKILKRSGSKFRSAVEFFLLPAFAFSAARHHRARALTDQACVSSREPAKPPLAVLLSTSDNGCIPGLPPLVTILSWDFRQTARGELN